MKVSTRVRASSWFCGMALLVTFASVMAGAPAKGEDNGINCVEGMPAVVDPTNLYSEACGWSP